MQEYFHPVKSLPGRENVRFPNLIKGNWNVERPLEIVVSDMTRAAKKTWQLVLMIQRDNSLTDSVGSNQSYYDCLEKLKNLIEDVPKLIDDYVRYFNSSRLAYSLNYKTPKLYKQELGF